MSHIGSGKIGQGTFGEPATPVGRSVAAPYGLAGRVAKSLVMPYKVLIPVGRSVAFQYYVFPSYLIKSTWGPPDEVDDVYVAQLPFPEAQSALLDPDKTPIKVRTRATWHHTSYDPAWGAWCVVNSEGRLAEYVGKWLLVSRRERGVNRSVSVLVHTADDALTEEISLARRAYAALSLLPLEPVAVHVEVLDE